MGQIPLEKHYAMKVRPLDKWIRLANLDIGGRPLPPEEADDVCASCVCGWINRRTPECQPGLRRLFAVRETLRALAEAVNDDDLEPAPERQFYRKHAIGG